MAELPNQALASTTLAEMQSVTGLSISRLKKLIQADAIEGNIPSKGSLLGDKTKDSIAWTAGHMKATYHGKKVKRQDRKPIQKLEHIGTDILSKQEIQSRQKNKYTMLFVDYHTGMVFAEYLKSKDEVPQAVKRFYDKIWNKSPQVTKTLHSDSEKVFARNSTIKEVLDSLGIATKLSVPYEHWGNGKVERAIGVVQDGVRTLLSQSGAPPSSWQDATEFYIRMLNECCLAPKSDKTRFELFHGTKPTWDGKVEFYRKGQAFLSSDERARGKQAPRTQPVTMIGYDDRYQARSYLLLNKDRKEIVRCNVKWNPIVPPTINRIRNCKVSNPTPATTSNTKFVRFKSPLSETFPTKVKASTLMQSLLDHLEKIMAIPTQIPMEEQSSNDIISPDNQDPLVEVASRLSNDDASNWPKTFGEALSSPDRTKWLAAIHTEIAALVKLGTFRDRDQLRGSRSESRPIRSKFVFEIKKDGRYKCRLVACGYSQRHGIDYFETYSPTASFKSFVSLMHLCGTMNHHLCTIDVGNAFLESKLDIAQVMKIPKDFLGSSVWMKSK